MTTCALGLLLPFSMKAEPKDAKALFDGAERTAVRMSSESVATGSTIATGSGATGATPTTNAKGSMLFDNGNIGSVSNKPTRPTTFTIKEPHVITLIQNYHWNNARGARPGTIGFRGENGLTYGPWQATGSPGQAGVPDAYWTVRPQVSIPAGTYTVIDSDPGSWAHNSTSFGRGFTHVEGYPATTGPGVPGKGVPVSEHGSMD